MKRADLLEILCAEDVSLGEVDILIQLPDNAPPVDFTVDVFDNGNTLIIFPTPSMGRVWKHDTNKIEVN